MKSSYKTYINSLLVLPLALFSFSCNRDKCTATDRAKFGNCIEFDKQFYLLEEDQTSSFEFSPSRSSEHFYLKIVFTDIRIRENDAFSGTGIKTRSEIDSLSITILDKGSNTIVASDIIDSTKRNKFNSWKIEPLNSISLYFINGIKMDSEKEYEFIIEIPEKKYDSSIEKFNIVLDLKWKVYL